MRSIDKLIPEFLRGESDFRWRGGDVSRVEGLSDGVFGFAMTLLVVSLEVPRSYGDLIEVFWQFPAFAACFALLMMIWYYNFLFHRRYGLEDGKTVALNALLLFVVLFYVYPLKFVATLLSDLIRGGGISTLPGRAAAPAISLEEAQSLMALYGAGFAAIFLVLALMTLHAWRHRDDLQLSEAERLICRSSVRAHLISVAIGGASVAVALAHPAGVPWSGMVYFLMGPAHYLNGSICGRRVQRLRAAR